MTISAYQIDDVLRLDFTTQDPTTGAITDDDATPTVEIYEDGGTAPIRTPAAAKRDVGRTGQYTFSDTLSLANGYEIGKTYIVYALSTVGGVSGGGVLTQFRIETKAVYVN